MITILVILILVSVYLFRKEFFIGSVTYNGYNHPLNQQKQSLSIEKKQQKCQNKPLVISDGGLKYGSFYYPYTDKCIRAKIVGL